MSIQTDGKIGQTNPLFNWQQKPYPTVHSSQLSSSKHSVSHINLQPIKNMSPTLTHNAVPNSLTTAQSQNQPQVAMSNNLPLSPPPRYEHNMGTNADQPPGELHAPTMIPAQFIDSLPAINNSPTRQTEYLPEPVNLQYFTNVAAVPLQQIQFVPCMCPVSVGIASEVISNKRSDNVNFQSELRDNSSELTTILENQRK